MFSSWTARQLPQTRQMRRIIISAKQFKIFKITSNDDFEKEVKRSDKPVIVFFFATWCGPCKMMTPRIENIITDMGGSIKLAKVDFDFNEQLAKDFGVENVPVLVATKNGKELDRMMGLRDTEVIVDWINKTLKENK